jgi:hypothetical protein
MIAKTTEAERDAAPEIDAVIDRFLTDQHESVAARLAAARAQILSGQATPLEPLEDLLHAARAGR